MQTVHYNIERQVVCSGWDGISFWVHARAGIVPGAGVDGAPAVVMTANKWLMVASDVFYDLNDFRTDDLGRTWSLPFRQHSLRRIKEPDGTDVAVSDFQPQWHAASGSLLGIGHTCRYRNDQLTPTPRRRDTAYSAYDPATRAWTEWQALRMPDDPEFALAGAGAGSVQRVDLEDGTVLVPVYYHYAYGAVDGRPLLGTTVLRCRFDGTTLSYIEHGTELKTNQPRGFGEGALARMGDRFFLTLRNDEAGFVVTSDDGLHFGAPREWTFDDGSPLGNYNTQQKWVSHGDALFLVYNRRGANNDHVFRHRAPLFMAQVDPERLCVIRASERVLVPERGARLGNFGVTDIGNGEVWVTVTEVMTPRDCSKYGSDNSVFVAKIRF